MDVTETRARVERRQSLNRQVKELLVDRLDLAVDPKFISDDQPMFGRGLELDSIDTLEIAVAVQEEFDVMLTDDDTESLLSVNRLCDHVEAQVEADE